ncbi:cell division protein FtsL [Paenibacillus thermoaerophilus]|uniref:Cell division protein FtsL n=1 Tax=Paenibacillus thermoaerophilus TaxID=1215385 RepID=A0ABW2V224_9BACL|nr:cell division protein FtsL [Paenibacillus thermoaerophilus]
MAYINGNLALERRQEEQSKARPAKRPSKPTAPAPRKNALPRQDKLLYLFAIVVGVAVALTVLFRYAQIYGMNVQLQNIEAKIEKLQAENVQLKREVMNLQDPNRIQQKAKEFGLSLPQDKQVAHVAPDGAAGQPQKSGR